MMLMELKIPLFSLKDDATIHKRGYTITSPSSPRKQVCDREPEPVFDFVLRFTRKRAGSFHFSYLRPHNRPTFWKKGTAGPLPP